MAACQIPNPSNSPIRIVNKALNAKVQDRFKRASPAQCRHDVTLTTADGDRISTHKMVLCICSPFLRNLIEKSGSGSGSGTSKELIIILVDVEFAHMRAIVEYMYTGETSVTNAAMHDFMLAANKLKIVGLAKSADVAEGSSSGAGTGTGPEQQQKAPAAGGANRLLRAALQSKKVSHV